MRLRLVYSSGADVAMVSFAATRGSTWHNLDVSAARARSLYPRSGRVFSLRVCRPSHFRSFCTSSLSGRSRDDPS